MYEKEVMMEEPLALHYEKIAQGVTQPQEGGGRDWQVEL